MDRRPAPSWLVEGQLRTGPSQRELRELVRYRTTLVRERSAEVNRLQKTLEGANIKLASVASDPLGLSGREMLNALVDGSTDVASNRYLAGEWLVGGTSSIPHTANPVRSPCV